MNTTEERTYPDEKTSMDIKDFAERYKVKLRKDECGDFITPGKQHRDADGQSDIFDGYDNGMLGVALLFGSARKWGSVRRRLQSEGFTLRQEGDTEGIMTFDPTNGKQSRLAIKMAGVRTKRQMAEPSPAQLLQRQKFATIRKNAPQLV